MKTWRLGFVLCLMSASAWATLKVSFIGDFYTSGMNIEATDAFPYVLGELWRECGDNIEVLGVYGQETRRSVSALPHSQKAIEQGADVIFLQLGVMDLLMAWPEYKPQLTVSSLSQAIEYVLHRGKKLVLLEVDLPDMLGGVEFSVWGPFSKTVDEDGPRKLRLVYDQVCNKYKAESRFLCVRNIDGHVVSAVKKPDVSQEMAQMIALARFYNIPYLNDKGHKILAQGLYNDTVEFLTPKAPLILRAGQDFSSWQALKSIEILNNKSEVIGYLSAPWQAHGQLSQNSLILRVPPGRYWLNIVETDRQYLIEKWAPATKWFERSIMQKTSGQY